jgi:N-acyl-D-amino-acid deacylase
MLLVTRSRLFLVFLCASWCVCLGHASIGQTQAPRYAVVITGGLIADGTGAPLRRADIGIQKGRIATIGTISATESTGADVINATGLVVAPGFIDVHTHADEIAEHPRAENFARMGVTTIVAGNCGSSAADISKATTEVEHVGTAVNFATLIGHNTVRRAVMGSANRNPTIGEMTKMKSLVWRAMADGAVGFSTGLQYVPGTYARPWEIQQLAQVACNAGGLYASHMRNEGTALEEAIAETLRVGESGLCRVQISHLKVDSPSRWGASAKALGLIDAARAKGLAVEADQYAYTAASSTLGIRFPSWVLEGGAEPMQARLNDPATWAKIKVEMQALLAERGLSDLSFAVVASHGADSSLNGLTMKQVAAKRKSVDSLDAQLESAREMMLAGGASMVYHFMSNDDVDRIMKHPFVGIASDSSLLTIGEGAPHPRGYGNSARVLGEYVRNRKVISLEEAVRKMTSLPADHFRFAGRGRLVDGNAADIVIFDRATVGDAATFEQPHAYARGIPYVLVNGVVIVRNGEHTGARPGMVLSPTKKAVRLPAIFPEREVDGDGR